ncbi:hypothetical protein DFH09DRAFT_1332653 [Mycena vulgaris]|nr:hypothetical protein DFH09DRAFT_1332653 [Mycena vulgaris]
MPLTDTGFCAHPVMDLGRVVRPRVPSHAPSTSFILAHPLSSISSSPPHGTHSPFVSIHSLFLFVLFFLCSSVRLKFGSFLPRALFVSALARTACNCTVYVPLVASSTIDTPALSPPPSPLPTSSPSTPVPSSPRHASISTRVAPVLPAPLPPLNAPNRHPLLLTLVCILPSTSPRSAAHASRNAHPDPNASPQSPPRTGSRVPAPIAITSRVSLSRHQRHPLARHALPLLRFSLPHPARYSVASRPFPLRLPDRCPAPARRWRTRRLHALSLTATIQVQVQALHPNPRARVANRHAGAQIQIPSFGSEFECQCPRSKSPASRIFTLRAHDRSQITITLPVLAIHASNLCVSQMHALANKCGFKSRRFESIARARNPTRISNPRLESRARKFEA